jgi:hypothetical protein
VVGADSLLVQVGEQHGLGDGDILRREQIQHKRGEKPYRETN